MKTDTPLSAPSSDIETRIPPSLLGITPLALARLRSLAGEKGPSIPRFEIDVSHLAQARQGSAQLGNAEVLAATDLRVMMADGRSLQASLFLQCRSTGPVTVTTHEEWIAKD